MNLLTLILCFTCLQNGGLAGAAEAGTDKDVSIIRCQYQNCAAIRNADVSIEIEDFFDTVEDTAEGNLHGMLIRERTLFRCIFDIAEGNYCQFSHAQINRTLFTDTETKPVESSLVGMAAFCVNDKEEQVFRRVGSKTWTTHRKIFPKSDKEFLKRLAYCDVRGLILGSRLDCQWVPESRDKPIMPGIDELSSNILSAKTVGNEMVITHLYKEFGFNMKGVGTKITTVYSLDSLMRLSETTSLYHHESKKSRKIQSVRYKWKELDGVMLPVTVKVEKRETKEVDGRSEPGWSSRTYKLTWNEVNSDNQDGKFFDGSLLESDASLQEQLLIPIESATSENRPKEK